MQYTTTIWYWYMSEIQIIYWNVWIIYICSSFFQSENHLKKICLEKFIEKVVKSSKELLTRRDLKLYTLWKRARKNSWKSFWHDTSNKMPPIYSLSLASTIAAEMATSIQRCGFSVQAHTHIPVELAHFAI